MPQPSGNVGLLKTILADAGTTDPLRTLTVRLIPGVRQMNRRVNRRMWGGGKGNTQTNLWINTDCWAMDRDRPLDYVGEEGC